MRQEDVRDQFEAYLIRTLRPSRELVLESRLFDDVKVLVRMHRSPVVAVIPHLAWLPYVERKFELAKVREELADRIEDFDVPRLAVQRERLEVWVIFSFARKHLKDAFRGRVGAQDTDLLKRTSRGHSNAGLEHTFAPREVG